VNSDCDSHLLEWKFQLEVDGLWHALNECPDDVIVVETFRDFEAIDSSVHDFSRILHVSVVSSSWQSDEHSDIVNLDKALYCHVDHRTVDIIVGVAVGQIANFQINPSHVNLLDNQDAALLMEELMKFMNSEIILGELLTIAWTRAADWMIFSKPRRAFILTNDWKPNDELSSNRNFMKIIYLIRLLWWQMMIQEDF
jgi:hypothetical protein